MSKLQDQPGRPKTVLQESCAVSHDETLHVSTTACVEQNISTQASMLGANSVQETETPITTLVESHQTDSSAGPASTILSTMSSMKLRDIMDKMRSCLFGWSWKQVSLFNLTGKDTATEKPTVHINPCTAIVPVRIQELFFPCSFLEYTVSCNQEAEELVAIPPQPSLAELELRLHLTGICDITARLCVIFRPECIVEVDCTILNFEAIGDCMRRIRLRLPTRSTPSALAIMPPSPSAVQVVATSDAQPIDCDNHEIALDVSLQEVDELVAIPLQPSLAELELRLQLTGICDITARLCVVFRPECIVEVDCTILNFEAIAEGLRRIGLRLPTRSTASALAIMPPSPSAVQVAATSEAQPIDCDNHEIALDVSLLEDTVSCNQEVAEFVAIPSQPSPAELQLRLQFPGICDITARLCVVFRPECIVEVDCTILNFEAIVDGMTRIGLRQPTQLTASASTLAIMPPPSSAVQVAATSEAQPVDCDSHEIALDINVLENTTSYNQVVEESLAIPHQPNPAELEVRLLFPGICDITARLCVVFWPEGIAEVYVSILRFVAIADDVREIDFQLPIESILSSPEFMSLQQVAVMSEVQPVYCDNYEMALETTKVEKYEVQPADCKNCELALYIPHLETQQVEDYEIQPVYCDNYEMARHAVHQETPQREDHEVQANDCENCELALYIPHLETQQVEEYKNQPVDCDNHKMALDVSLLEDTTCFNQLEVEESLVIPPQPSPAELELRLQFPGICDITARLCVVFWPEGIAEVYVSILRFVAIADDIREIDFQIPIESILSSPEFMSLQQVAVMSEVQCVDRDNYEMALETPQVEDHEVHPVQHSSIPAPTATDEAETINIEEICSRLASMSGHDDVILPVSKVAASQDDVDLKGSEIFFGKAVQTLKVEDHEVHRLQHSIEEICSRLASMSGHDDVILPVSKVAATQDDVDLRGSEIFFGKAVQSEVENPVAEKVASGKDVPSTSDDHSSAYNPTTAATVQGDDLDELCSRLASIDTSRPASESTSCKNEVDFKGLELFFGKTIKSEDNNRGAERAASEKVLPTPSEQFLAVLREFYPLPTQVANTPEAEVESNDCANSDASQTNYPHLVLVQDQGEVKKDLTHDSYKSQKGSNQEELSSQSEKPIQESVEVALTEFPEKFKPLDEVNHQNVRCRQTTEEGVPSATFVSAQCDLRQQEEQEAVNAKPGLPSERIQLQDDVSTVVLENHVEENPTKDQTVAECTRSSPSVEKVQHTGNVVADPSEEEDQLSDSVTALCHATQTVDAQPMYNALAEAVTRGIKEIRKSVDVTVRGIENVTLEGPTERRRKMSHEDESNQLLSKDIEIKKTEVEALSMPSLMEAVEKTRDSQLVTQRYPSDVQQALMTQTVDLLERGIVLVSDDGSFKAVVNPSSVSRIGFALTGNNFSRHIKHYDNDVLPEDLKQKVIERAALVAREHQDRALEGLTEIPIFTLSEIQHFDCNGDYIMEDVSSSNTPVYPFTGIQPTQIHQCFVNPFQAGITPQGLLTSGMHTPFQMMQQYTVDDIEMIDVDELYMDIDESIEDVFMECDHEVQTDCPYCSQISLNLLASLPTKYAISRRAIYSLLDERPLNPEIPSWSLKERTKKSWFAYNTFSFRPEFEVPSGGLSRKDRVIYSLLDQRPLNPALSPSLARQSKMKSWLAYNTFSFREGDLVPIGSKCNCIQTEIPFQAASQSANTVPSTVEPWPKLEQVSRCVFPCTSEQNTTASKSPFNTFSFSFGDHNSQQVSIFGENKQESVFSFGKTEQQAPPTEPVLASSEVSWKDFSFREEDNPKHVAFLRESKQQSVFSFGKTEQPVTPTEPVTVTSGVSWKDFSFREEDDPKHLALTSSLLQAEEDESHDTKQQPTDLSLEPAEQDVNDKTLTFALGQEQEQPVFPVSEDNDSTSSEAESHDEDLFDLNDENEELVIKEIIDAVKSRLKESKANLPESEEPSNTSVESEPVKDNKTSSKEESITKVDEQKVELKTNSETKDKVDKSVVNGTGQSLTTNHVSQDASQTAQQETCKTIAEPPSKLTISHSKSITKRTEPYPTQAGSGLAAFLRRRRVKVVERDRLKTLQVSTQVSQVDTDADSSKPVTVLAENVQQRKVVSLKSLMGNTKTPPSSKRDLSITIAPSDDEDRKVVSLKSIPHDRKPDSPTASSIAVPPVQSEVNSSKKKVSFKSLNQTKNKEPDVKGSEMDRLKSRTQRKDSDTLSKSTPSTVNSIKRVSFAQSDRAERETSTNVSQPTVSSVAEKRGKVISLRSVIQSKKVDPISKSSSPESHVKPIQGAFIKPLNQAKISEQISKPAPEEGSSKLASLKSPTQSPKADSMSNSIPQLPLVSSGAENSEVVSLNHVPKGRNTEASSKLTHSVATAPSGVKKTNVVSLKSLTQRTCKKDEQVKNAVASVPQVSSDVNKDDSKESSCAYVVKNKVVLLKPATQCKKVNSIKEPASYAAPVCSKIETSDIKDSVKSMEQSKAADPLKDSSTSKSLSAVKVKERRIVSLKSLTRDCKSETLNKAAVSPPQVSTMTESSAEKTTFKSTIVRGKESAPKKSSPSKAQVPKEKNAKVVAMETALSQVSCVGKTGSARKVAFKSTHERQKEDTLVKSSPPTAPVSSEKKAEIVSLKKESHASSVAESSCARVVPLKSKLQKKVALKMPSTEPASGEGRVAPLKSKLQKKDALKMPSTEPVSCEGRVVPLKSKLQKNDALKMPSTEPVSCEGKTNVVSLKSVSQSEKECPLSKSSSSKSPSSCDMQKSELMSFKSVTKRERAIPVRSTSRVPRKVENKVASLETLKHSKTADVKSDGSAIGHQQHTVSEPSNSGEQKSFQTLTSSHKRELDEMLEEDQLSDIERLRKFDSRRRKPLVGNSGDVDNNKNSEANKAVKLVKTDVVQDTSIAKRNSVTTKQQVKPISLAVDVNTVKNESTSKWKPGTLEKTKPSPEGRVAVTDVPKSTNYTMSSHGTSQESNPASLVKTDVVSVTGAVQSSPAIPNPDPLPRAEVAEVAEVKTANTVDMNVAQSSRITTPTRTEPSPLHDTDTVSKDTCASNTVESSKAKDRSEKSCLPEPEQSSSSMDLVKEPLCLAGVVALSGEVVNSEQIHELPPVPQPAAENVTLGKRKLEDMQDEDEEIPTVKKEKPVEEVKKKRRWRTVEKTPENHEQQNKPRRIVRNKLRKG